MPARASPASCSTICATPCSRQVGQNAAQRLAGQVFRHIHRLSLRFHLERRTGIADQGRRARDQEHRHDALFPAVQHRPDDHRAGRDLRHLLDQVRPGPGRRDAGDRRHLYRLHPLRHRLALAAAARDERGRQPRDRPRRRLAAQLRDGQIFRRRGARGEALRRGHRRTSPAPPSATKRRWPGSTSASR